MPFLLLVATCQVPKENQSRGAVLHACQAKRRSGAICLCVYPKRGPPNNLSHRQKFREPSEGLNCRMLAQVFSLSSSSVSAPNGRIQVALIFSFARLFAFNFLAVRFIFIRVGPR